jgi:hypothetical protein
VHNPNCIIRAELGPKSLDKTFVDLNSHDSAAGTHKASRKCTQTRTYLRHVITRFDPGEPNYTVNLIGVDKEVLPQRFIRVQSESREQVGCALSAMLAGLSAQRRWRPHTGQGLSPSSSKSWFAILSWSAGVACDGSTPTSSGQ